MVLAAALLAVVWRAANPPSLYGNDRDEDLAAARRMAVVVGKYQAGTPRAEFTQRFGEPYESRQVECKDDPNSACEEAYWYLDGDHHVVFGDFKAGMLVGAQEDFSASDKYPHCDPQLDGSGHCWDKDDHVYEADLDDMRARNGQ